jgi:hypothetical protein
MAGDNLAHRWRALRERSPKASPMGLDRAPVLDNWEPRFGWGGDAVLYITATISSGHPRLRSGAIVETSEVVEVDGDTAHTPARWVRTKNTLYALGYPRTALRPLIEAAMAPNWATAARWLVDATGTWTVDEPTAKAMIECLIATDARRERAFAGYICLALAERARYALRDAWLLLSADVTEPGAARMGATLLDSVGGGDLGAFARVRDAWAQFAERRRLPPTNDAIAWGRQVAETLSGERQAHYDAFLEAAAARCFDDAWGVVRMHLAPQFADRLVTALNMSGEYRRRALRELRQAAEEADDGTAADLLRLLAINPADRRDVAWVADLVAVRRRDLDDADTLNRWLALRDAAHRESDILDPYDPFSSSVHAYATEVAGLLEAEDIGYRRQPAEKAAEDTRGAAAPSLGVVVMPEIGGTSQTASAREVQREFKDMVGQRMPLATVPPLAPVRAALADEFPHLTEQIETAIAGLVEGCPLRLQPILLTGEPGGGKSRFARRLAETLGVYLHPYDGAGSSDNAFAGTSRRWSSGSHCVPLEAVRKSGIANPFLLIDEAEKGGTSRQHGSLADCLNTFLEPSTARHFNDLFVEATVDLSHVNYLLTANDPTRLPATVRDRLTPIVMPQPEEPHLPQIARSIVADLARENPLGEAWVAPLEDWELAIAEELWRGGSVRRLSRIVRSILIQRQRSPRKH